MHRNGTLLVLIAANFGVLAAPAFGQLSARSGREYAIAACEVELSQNPARKAICPCQYELLRTVLTEDAMMFLAAVKVVNFGDAEAIKQSHPPGWDKYVTAAYNAVFGPIYLACDPVAK